MEVLVVCFVIAWFVRVAVEDGVAAVRGTESPRITRQRARQEMARAAGVPTIGQAAAARFATAIAPRPGAPRRHPALQYVRTRWEDAWDELTESHNEEMRRRAEERRGRQAREAEQRRREQEGPGQPHDDIVDAEVVDRPRCSRCRWAEVDTAGEQCPSCRWGAPGRTPPPGPSEPPPERPPAPAAAVEDDTEAVSCSGWDWCTATVDQAGQLCSDCGHAAANATGWPCTTCGRTVFDEPLACCLATPETAPTLPTTYGHRERIPGACRNCMAHPVATNDDGLCEPCARGRFGYAHYCPGGCGTPVAEHGRRCPDCPPETPEPTPGAGSTTQPDSGTAAHQEGTRPMSEFNDAHDYCDAAHGATRSSTQEGAPDMSQPTVINGDVHDPWGADAHATACATFVSDVGGQAEIAANELAALKVGPAAVAEIRGMPDDAAEFLAAAEGAGGKFREHQRDADAIAENDDIAHTVDDTYMSRGRGA